LNTIQFFFFYKNKNEVEKLALIFLLQNKELEMKFSMTGQEKGDLLIEVTAWAGLTAICISYHLKLY
jgi:hypothetical protein